LSGATVAIAYVVGAAGLGLWGVVRFPSRGPRTIAVAVLVAACAWCFLRAAGGLTHVAFDHAGPGVALLCVFLPILTFAFWSAAHVIRLATERLAPYKR